MDCPARDGTGGFQVGFLSKDQSFEALLLGLKLPSLVVGRMFFKCF